MKHFFVFSGGDLDDKFACQMIEDKKPDAMIAADRGMDFFYRNHKEPDMIIGDFDSVENESLQYFRGQTSVKIVELSPMKDDTDTEAAIRWAMSMGAEKITILGATGCRLDHVLGNVELLGMGLADGVQIEIVDAYNRIRMIDRGINIRRAEQHGTYVSLLPYTETVTNLTLRGFKYSLEDAILSGFCTLGVSNEIVEEEAEITFGEGILLVIESRD